MKHIFSALFLFVGFGATAQTFKPELKIKAGQKFTVISNTKGSMSQEVMGQSIEIPIDVTVTNILEVKKMAGDSYDLTNTVSRMILSMSAMGQDINYDSDKAEDRNSDAGRDLNTLVNNPTDFKVNSFGKIVEGSVKKQSPEKPEPGGNPLTGMININDEKEPSQAVNLFDSGAPINIGDSFVVKNNSTDGKIKKSLTYTLVEIKNGIAKFSINAIDSIVNEMEMQGMQMTSNNTTKSTGEMLVNTTTGILIKKSINQVISGNIEAMGMTIPVSGNNTITISVLEMAK